MQSHIFVCKIFQGDTENNGCSHKGNMVFCKFNLSFAVEPPMKK